MSPPPSSTSDPATPRGAPGIDGVQRTAPDTDDAATRWERRLATPALVAALASIPAVFLTLADGALGTTGRVLDLASAAVLVAEGVIPLVLTHDRRDWMRRHRWWLVTVAVVIPAVLLAAGPAQLLRLVRSVGALRVLRVRRIVKAGRVVTRRLDLSQRWRRVAVTAASLLAAAFVAIVLADPTSTSGGVARSVVDTVGPVGVVAAGALLAGATYLVVRDRDAGSDDDSGDGTDDDDPDDETPTRRRRPALTLRRGRVPRPRVVRARRHRSGGRPRAGTGRTPPPVCGTGR